MMSMHDAVSNNKNYAVKRYVPSPTESLQKDTTTASMISAIMTASTSSCSGAAIPEPKKVHQSSRSKAKIEQLQLSLKEALKENDGLLRDAELLIERYEALEHRHNSTVKCKDKKIEKLQQELNEANSNLILQKFKFDKERLAMQQELKTYKKEAAKLRKELIKAPIEPPKMEEKEPEPVISNLDESNHSREDKGFLFGTTRLDIDVANKREGKHRGGDVLRRTWHGGATERTQLGLDILGVDVRKLFRRAKSTQAPAAAALKLLPAPSKKKEEKSQRKLSNASSKDDSAKRRDSVRFETNLGKGRRLSLNIEVNDDDSRNIFPSKTFHGGGEMASMNRLVEEAKKQTQPPPKDDTSEPESYLANAQEIAAFLDLTQKNRKLKSTTRAKLRRKPDVPATNQPSETEDDEEEINSCAPAARKKVGTSSHLLDHGSSSISTTSTSFYKRLNQSMECSAPLTDVASRVPFDITIYHSPDDCWLLDDGDESFLDTNACKIKVPESERDTGTLLKEWREGFAAREAVWNGALGA